MAMLVGPVKVEFAGSRPVDVEFPDLQEVLAGGARRVVSLVVAVAHERVGRAGRRRSIAVRVGRDQSLKTEGREIGGGEALRRGDAADEHLRPVEGVGGGAALIARGIVGVRPDTVFRVVRKAGRGELIGEPAAGDRIAGLGDVDAETVAGAAELAQEPAVGELVEEHDRIAEAGGAVAGAESLHRGGTGGHGAVGLVVDREHRAAAAVDALDVMSDADVTYRIRRIDPGEALAGEIEDRRSQDPERHPVLHGEQRIDLGLGRRRSDPRRPVMATRDLLDRISGLPFRRPRQVAQVAVENRRYRGLERLGALQNDLLGGWVAEGRAVEGGQQDQGEHPGEAAEPRFETIDGAG